MMFIENYRSLRIIFDRGGENGSQNRKNNGTAKPIVKRNSSREDLLCEQQLLLNMTAAIKTPLL